MKLEHMDLKTITKKEVKIVTLMRNKTRMTKARKQWISVNTG